MTYRDRQLKKLLTSLVSIFQCRDYFSFDSTQTVLLLLKPALAN